MNSDMDLCTWDHECHSCHKGCKCNTYVWACPWRNGDEDQMCIDCLEHEANDIEEWDEDR